MAESDAPDQLIQQRIRQSQDRDLYNRVESAAQAKYWRSVSKRIKGHLEDDLYTNAFVSFFELPLDHKDRLSKLENYVTRVMPVIFMLIVCAVQILATYGVQLYVQGSMVRNRENDLRTAEDLFHGAGASMPIGLADKICGQNEQMELSDGPYSKVTMPDGSVFEPGTSFPSVYNMRQPTRSWSFKVQSDDHPVLIDAMHNIEEGVTLNPLEQTGFSALFIMMASAWFFTMISELRSIGHFANMLWAHHPEDDENTSVNLTYLEDTETFRVSVFTCDSLLIGLVVVILRIAVALYLGYTGCFLLFFTTDKFGLVMNSIALLFVLDLDNLMYVASVSAMKQKFIDDIEPPTYTPCCLQHASVVRVIKVAQPVVTMMMVLFFGMALRHMQVRFFEKVFEESAALCLFAGPTPSGRSDLVAPVVGFCETLLSAMCFGSVAHSTHHGPCLVTDQRFGNTATYSHYISPALFTNTGSYNFSTYLHNKELWNSRQQFYHGDKGVYMQDSNQDLLRFVCLNLYQNGGTMDSRSIDSDTGELATGAPFYCQKSLVWDAVFSHIEVFDGPKKGRPSKLDANRTINALMGCANTMQYLRDQGVILHSVSMKNESLNGIGLKEIQRRQRVSLQQKGVFRGSRKSKVRRRVARKPKVRKLRLA